MKEEEQKQIYSRFHAIKLKKQIDKLAKTYTQEAIIKTHNLKLSKFIKLVDYLLIE